VRLNVNELAVQEMRDDIVESGIFLQKRTQKRTDNAAFNNIFARL
jgi:hypothetical protein